MWLKDILDYTYLYLQGCVTMYGQPSNVLHASTDTTKLFTEKDDKFSNSS